MLVPKKSSFRSPSVALIVLVLAVLGPRVASAACPDSPAECLGDAAHFALVTQGKVKLGVSYLAEDGRDPFWAWTTIEGDVCADRITAVSPPPGGVGGYNTTVFGDLAVLATTGLGVVATTVGTRLPDAVGLDTNRIATAGSLVGPRVGASSIDTSGTDPLIELCQSAHPAALAAVEALSELPATANLGRLALAPGENRTIPLGPGLNVFDASEVRLGRAARLVFANSDDLPTWVVVRTRSLKTSTFADMNSGAPLLFVLAGKGPTAVLGRFSDNFGIGVLAPERSVKMMGEVFIEGVWAKKAALGGVDLLPSGEFEP